MLCFILLTQGGVFRGVGGGGGGALFCPDGFLITCPFHPVFKVTVMGEESVTFDLKMT